MKQEFNWIPELGEMPRDSEGRLLGCCGGHLETMDFYAGRERCCDEDYGGGHYHCLKCGAVTSMMGHYTEEECEVSRRLGHDRPEWLEDYLENDE